MKYKCIKPYVQYDVEVMSTDDIIVFDGYNLFNVTKKTDIKNISNPAEIRECLEFIADNPPYLNETVNPAEEFESITKQMVDVFKRKNHDYGNSFEESLNDEGIAASRIRLRDKWNRFVQLSRGRNAQVNTESIQDTLLDMANYCIMTIMWMNKNS